ncbi:glycoside hydrolase family 35 protein [Paenibacillus daejeonensis]|uniref:glycoside hydrolase family 35 protein n=1 Tax=Paenibacillus daejeonensis TaxID=135193 RepID=UPI00035E128C|nr:beta-galactosidase family protein [Paenibacillus daejeonensis]
MAQFGVEGDHFVFNGEQIQLLSGAIHYFRVVPEYWEDRLIKLKALGLNTVETYMPWNGHEPRKGEFCFTGLYDFEKFVKLAGDLGLHVILRPSPYICAEWEFGGLPAWLLAESDIRLRCYDETYLKHLDAYYDELLPRIEPLLCTHGGPVIALQIENEYGSYGNDKQYLAHIRDAMVSRGMDVLLFTSDGPTDSMLQGGTLEGVLATVNFGSRATEAFATLRKYQPEGPLMCMEFWNGWFDHWMDKHHTREAADVAVALDEMLAAGASVNFYMLHGGTNFGYLNGANHVHRYEPTVTSYDYDALLNEAGEPTAKYWAAREVLGRYVELPPLQLPEPTPKRGYGTVRLEEQGSLFGQLDALSVPVQATCPEPMEKLGQAYGYILYSTFVPGPKSGMSLHVQEVRDRAIVYVDGQYHGVVERWQPEPLKLDIPEQGAQIDILVENMGRINYGPLMADRKGITEGVRLDNQFLYHWTIRSLPLETLEGVSFVDEVLVEKSANEGQRPAFYRGHFEVDDLADTFLRLDNWTKGQVYINGFLLGRYWEAGPTRTLYIPAPLLRAGRNELVVFELHGTRSPDVVLTDEADLG